MPKMRAVQVPGAGRPFELVEREIPEPGTGWVRIKVQACGICHSDSLVKEGHWPGISYPRVPGHEVAGVIDTVGAEIIGWRSGQRVGVGWYGGHCGHCESCRRGDFITCRYGLVTGISFDGGYADYMLAPAQALALVPQDSPPLTQHLCCVQASQRTMPSATAVRGQAIWWRSLVWADSDTSASSTRPEWALILWPSPVEKTKSYWLASWAQNTTLIAKHRTQQRN